MVPESGDEPRRLRVVALVSGSGTLLQALLDAARERSAYPAHVVAVGADRHGIEGLARADRAAIPAFVQRVKDHPDREAWDAALASDIASYSPGLVVSAGFMKVLGPQVLAVAPVLNTHPALLPSFPGAHAVRDALAYGVKVTGATAHLVDEGVDTGPVVAQSAVPVQPDDDEASLHERIKVREREMLVDVVGRMARDGWSVSGRKVTIP